MAGLACLPLAGAARERAAPAQPPSETRIWMRAVIVYPFPDAPVTVERLSGTVTPTQPGRLVNMDDVGSYRITVAHAEVQAPGASLAALLNRYVLPSAGTDIQKVSVQLAPGEIQLRGTLRKGGLPIGFSATAAPAPAPSGELSLKVVKMKAAGFIPKSLLDALGLTLEKVAQPERRNVFRIEGDTMLVPVPSMFPPPKFFGKLTSVRVTPAGLQAVIEGPEIGPPPPERSAAYLMFRGGRVSFGRLTMTDADLTLLPKKTTPSLGFSPAEYFRQLVGGYSISKPDRGLVAYVADYRDLSRR
jgi:hypothetical protein